MKPMNGGYPAGPDKPIPGPNYHYYQSIMHAVRLIESKQSAFALYKDEPVYLFLDHAIKYLLEQADCVMRGKPVPEYR